MRFHPSTIAVDFPILVVTCLVSVYLVTHTDRQLESTLGLVSTQWLYDMSESNRQMRERTGGSILPVRERYARRFPRSPIARANRIPAVMGVEKALGKWIERGLPALAVASVGLGIVAIRRPDRGTRHARWGPGRVAAAIGLITSSASILIEFILRRFDLMKYGIYHDTMIASWATNARTTAVAILGAWLLIAASALWRTSKGWRERLGLAIGALWLTALAWQIVLAPLSQL